MKDCKHEQFETEIKVARLVDREGGSITGYSADIRIRCVQCGLPFQFVGVPGGWSPSQPMASADYTELRAPIRPSNDPAEQMKAIVNQIIP